MADYMIKADIRVREVDHPFTPEEALRAARQHFGTSYQQKPIEDVKLRAGDDEIVVTVETTFIQIAQEELDPFNE